MLHLKRMESETQSVRAFEILYSLKNKSLNGMEKLMEEVCSEGSLKPFNEETFEQLYKVYSSLEAPTVSELEAVSVVTAEPFELNPVNGSYYRQSN